MLNKINVIVVSLLLAATQPTTDPATSSWHDIEQQIAWHREQVRLCGPLSAIRVLHLLGHKVSPRRLLSPFYHTDPNGTSVHRILTLCQQYHPATRLVQLPGAYWRRLTAPCILIINQRKHAIVLESISVRKRTANIWDPSIMTSRVVSLDWLEQRWSGDAILFRPRPWRSVLLGLANVVLLITLLRHRHIKRRSTSADTNSN